MHLLKPKYKIQISQLPNCGKGLFTMQAIKKYQYIFQYTGKIRRKSEVNVNNMYCVSLSQKCVLDGFNRENICRFINDAEGYVTCSTFANNTCLVRWKNKVFIQAIRDISKKEELFLAYGLDYWKVFVDNQAK